MMNTWIVGILLALQAGAHDGYFGAHLGLTDTNGPGTSKEVEASGGGRIGYILYDRVAVGAYVNYYVSKQVTENIAYLPTLAEVSFFPLGKPQDVSALRLSAYFGSSYLKISDALGKRSEVMTTVGAGIGYSVFLDSKYLIGPEFQQLYIFDDMDNFHIWSVQLNFQVLF